jgi:S1-C subfamily serine protease
VNWLDWAAAVVLVLATLSGYRRGLVAGALSLVGLVGGALIGARVAPGLVGDGAASVPFLALGATAAGGMLGRWVGGMVGGWARSSLWVVPPLRWVDSVGGLVLGLATGLVLVWIVGIVLLNVPGQPELRRTAQESAVLSSLTEAIPPDSVIDALARVDPFLTIVGPAAGVDAPDPATVRDPDVRRSRGSVVRLRGVACGVGIEGSGWIVAPGLVVTNAHVVAGVARPRVDGGTRRARAGTVVSFDASRDVAIVRVPGLRGTPLRRAAPVVGAPAATLGFPANGPYRARPARIGRSATVPSRDAYGRLQAGREIVAFRGTVEGGSSGGPVVNADGRVVTTVFARRAGTGDGYGVPNAAVTDALRGAAAGPLETACVER